ncbi:MAG: hypothetical protein QM736_10970 [Vicinamibacterales bacterium]
MSRPADIEGQYLLDGKDVSTLPRDELARPQPADRLRLSGVQPAAAHLGGRECRAAAALHATDGGAGRTAARAMEALAAVGLENRMDHIPTSCPAGSSSASRLPARW